MIIDKLLGASKNLKKPEYLKMRSLEFYRTATSNLRLLPEFLIIGVQKGGTTSLYRYLEQHPCVASAFVKEVHFFDNHNRANNYGKGIAWYRSHFVYSVSKSYHHMFYRRSLITGEGSPDYIFDPNAPRRIAAVLPKVKLIILLRNPVERAYSHYLHNVRAQWDLNRENLSFEDAIAAEPDRLDGEYEKLIKNDSYFSYNYMHYSYLKRGLYSEQIETWLKLFPREQLLILKSEDFFTQPASTFKKVLEFLDLPAWEPNDFQLFNTRNKNSVSLSSSTKSQLEKYFHPYNLSLYKLLEDKIRWDF